MTDRLDENACEPDDLADGVVVAVARAGGRAWIVAARAFEASEPQAAQMAWLLRARRAGAAEFHLHRLAETAPERRRVADDLAPGIAG